ncbi:hypothetical protein L6164_022265 [Bauhinia variegata]|uniref:Uncharacterized protein n=1 Tax=Bauhinia variegata TaxID=167791 RepID=A0ACB9MEK2_BAUVA|nr:hypothetical protein L6164_022265 [Bauhinia variegata]
MGKLGLFCFLVVQVLVLQAMANDSEAAGLNPNSLELKTETAAGEHENRDRTADEPVSSTSESEAAEAPEIRRLGKHHSTDKSVAGGGVIIGGLVTAICAAVFCYIRVTRKREDGH